MAVTIVVLRTPVARTRPTPPSLFGCLTPSPPRRAPIVSAAVFGLAI